VIDALFGECSGGFVVSGEADGLRELREGVRVLRIGEVGGDALRILDVGASVKVTVALTLDELADAHCSLGELFG
jgi:hypothetical protein